MKFNMEIDFFNIDAVLFSMDGVIYDNKELTFRLILSDIFHAKWIKKDIEVRKALQGTDFETSESFYASYFEKMSQECHTSKEKYRIRYFTKFLPNMCNTLKDYYSYREGLDDIFLQLKRNEIPFLIYSDYVFAKERGNAIGLQDIDYKNFLCLDEIGCQKPAPRGFKEIENLIIYKKAFYGNILVVSTDDKVDKECAKNAGFTFLKINDDEISSSQEDEMSWDDFITKFSNALRQKTVQKSH